MRLILVTVLGIFVLGGWTALGTAQAQEKAKADTFNYVGVKKCKMCHKSKTKGNQFGIWSETGHAKAFETLASEKALAEAKKQGIADPQKAPECLKCHVTAFPVMDKLADLKITLEEGISCESCHGPGSAYKSKKVMQGLRAGKIKPESVGLLAVNEATCTKCHTKEGNPFYKEFVFKDRVKTIAHPIPKAAPAEEKK